MAFDFRSDTVTKPSPDMRKAMYDAEVGDDVYDEDPTVNALQERMADIFGMEAGIFVTSGTQGNLLALLSHCERGAEYIVGQTAHTYKYEAGGGAVLGSIQPQPLDFNADGTIDLDKAQRAIKPDDQHFARTRLFCLENTNFGKALPLDYLESAAIFVRDNGLAFHLDGARVFNAAVKCGVDASQITSQFDSVSACFSKGLGAPVGSILCGSREFITRARRVRKIVGGGMRQVGVIAAAAMYAANNNIERLAEDHENAKWLAQELSSIDQIEVEYHPMQTNMVFIQIDQQNALNLKEFLAKQDIIISAGTPMRLVTHLDVNREAAAQLAAGFKAYFSQRS